MSGSPATADCSIEGRISEATGTPIPAVDVQVLPGDAETAGALQELWTGGASPAQTPPTGSRFTTDEEGRYRIAGLPAGRYRVRADSGRHLPGERAVVVDPGQAAQHVDVVLAEGGRIEGRVLAPAGHSAAGVTVRARAPGAVRTELHALTDARGGFAIRGVPPGALELEAEGPAGRAGPLREYLPAGSPVRTGIEIALVELGSVEGVVTDADARPVADAIVFWALAEDIAGQASPPKRVETDPSGRFSLGSLAPGEYELLVRTPDSMWVGRRSATVAPGASTRANVTVGPSASLRGELRTPEGEPIGRCRLFARSEDGAITRYGQSSADGQFVIRNLYAGTYLVGLAPGEQLIADPLTVALEAGARQRVGIVARPGATLAFDVRLTDGAPAAAAFLFAIREGDYVGRGQTDSAGMLELGGLSAGKVELYVRTADFDLVARRAIEIPETGTLSVGVDLERAGSLEGTTVNASGAPVPGAVVRLVGPEPLGRVRREVRADERGRFEVLRLYHGRYAVEGWAGATSGREHAEVQPGGRSEVRLTLRAP